MNAASKWGGTLRQLGAKSKGRRDLKRLLRGPTELDYAIASRIDLLGAPAWDAVTAGRGLFSSRAYLAMLERVLPANLSPRYALIFAPEQGLDIPVAAVIMQIADIAAHQLKPLPAAGERLRADWLRPLKTRLAERAHQRVLTCGNFLTYGQHGVAIADGVDPATAWHAVAEVPYRVRHAEKIAGGTHFALIKDLCGDDLGAAKLLEHLSYRWVETEPNMVLALDPAWRSHEDYLASLASKYRSGIRNSVLKPIEAAGCTVETLAAVDPAAARLHALYKSVQDNAAVRPFELPAAYFSALAAVAGERCRVSVVRRREAVIGFLVSLADGETGYAYHIGFDRDAAAELPIYLRLLHAGIADGIALRVKRISFGRTALEPKAALGARPEQFGVLIRHRQPVLNKLLKHVLTGIEHNEPPARNPFKKAAIHDA